MNSRAARGVRILTEYERTALVAAREDVRATIVFFGSARSRPLDEAQAEFERLKAAKNSGTAVIVQAEKMVKLAHYYDAAQRLSRRLSEWNHSLYRQGRESYLVCTGGGPGMMEAANRGASQVKGARNVGFGISLPKEQGNNAYVTPELSFEFHYFFMRKFWLVYPCRAMVVMPGGFGSMDELFEVLCMVQTKKLGRRLPIVLFGAEFWEPWLALARHMIDWGTLSSGDLDLVHVSDRVDDAYLYITKSLEEIEKAGNGRLLITDGDLIPT
ncbi:LOG family protein [Patescibacteria group bacterium]|nr:LOG family protein [Patescibacteria group bacterium]MBU1673468.1 LOG family protein [Patescibacteria group bacterium]MBU1962910.1 LOG family protein [Patescibacteria group bacterium]